MLQGIRYLLLGMMLFSPVVEALGIADAHEAYRRGDLARLQKAEDVLRQDVLGAYPRYWLLERQISVVSPSAVESFLQSEDGSYLAERLREEWVRELSRRSAWPGVEHEYAKLKDHAQDLSCFYWQALATRGAYSFDAEAKALWLSARDLPGACTPVFAGMINRQVLNDDDVWSRARIAFAANEPAQARYWLAHQGQELSPKEVDLAGNRPEQFLKDVAMTNRRERELALYALVRLAHSDLEAAQHLLQSWRGHWPADSLAYGWQQLGLQGARRQDLRALEWFKEGEPLGDAAREWQVRLALRQGNWEAVQLALDAMSPAKRQERTWQYWRARSLLQRGKTGQANRLIALLSQDDDYYGLLARDLLGPVASDTQTYQPTEEDVQRVEAVTGIRRALALREAGLREEAVHEWNWTMRGLDDRELLACAEVANRYGWYDRAIYAAERTQKLHNIGLRYLSPYREIMKGYADELRLDESWVYGLIRQESRFTPAARSGVGAGGLMQLMPTTAQWVANKLGIRYHAGMVNEVGRNVQLGTYYLKHILQQLDNNPVLATAAYNAGPNRAREWQAGSPMEAAIYVESIPFAETRDYVKKVMSNAEHYAMTFGQGKPSSALHLGTIPARGSQAIAGP